MGKGSRVRDERAQNGNENGAVRLSKKQIIRLQEKKKRNKKILTWAISAVIAVALIVAFVIPSIFPKVPNLEKHLVAKNELIEIDGAMYAYVVYDYVGQYGSYLSQQGFNPNYGLLEQTTQYSSGGTTIPWYKYFCDLADAKLNEYVAFASAQLAKLAKEKGSAVTIDEALTKEDKDQIKDYMKELEKHAYDNGYGGISKFLSAVYTPGVTEGALRRYLKIEALAYAYVEDYLDSLTYTDEQLDKYREDTPDSFKKIDYVYYTFTETYIKDATAEQKAEAKAKAEAAAKAFLDEHKTVESFKDGIYELEKAKKDAATTTTSTTTASGTTAQAVVDAGMEPEKEREELVSKFITTGSLYNSTKAEAADTKAYYEWAYSADRVANDTFTQDATENTTSRTYSVTVYIIENGVYIDEYDSQDVRHILFKVDTSLKGTALEKAFDKAKQEAEKVLEEYNKGDKTADAFGALAKEHTADSNGEDGGLYENVLKGQMVTEFEDWIYNADRKEGDVELVKTEYGWHIMYYVGKGKTAWKVTAENGLKNEDYEKHLEELQEEYELDINSKAKFYALGGED